MAAATHVTVRKRAAYLFFMFIVIILGLVCRLIYLQFYQSSWLMEGAIDQRVRDIPVGAKRGMIFDRNGREFGISISTESIYAIPAEIRNVDETAAKLAAILALDAEKLSAKLKKRQAFTWVKRQVSAEQGIAIKKLNLSGIGVTEESRRYYPQESLAAHVLGFTGIDNQGLDGVEFSFDSYLRGRPGRIVIEYDASGREIPSAAHRFIPPVDGNNIYLTIDLLIQEIVERELEKVMRDTQAKAASIIVMEPHTGEILAMANRPTYNPNQFSAYAPQLWRNIAVSNAYEPGSTFKIITTSAVLSEKVVRTEERFFDPGSIEVQGRNIHCWKPGGHGSQTFEEVVQNSCNVGFVTAGLRLRPEVFYQYLKSFGFDQVTNVDLPGEAKGLLIRQDKVKSIDIATMSIGQSIAVTPLQLVNAVAAVANEGRLSRPQIVRDITDKDGTMIRSFAPDVIKQVIDPKTAGEVKRILESVVEKGTGKNAYVEEFNIAGKTGTAQKAGSGGYMAGKYVASFVGFAPVDDPQIAMLIVIDEPQGLYYGGQIAAPVFGAAIADILPYLQVTPRPLADNSPAAPPAHVTVPNVLNLPIADAVKKMTETGLLCRVEESGERVGDQIPKPGSLVPKGSTALLYTAMSRYGLGEVTVPDCRGLSVNEVLDLLGEVGLMVQIQGDGKKVSSQEPPPGMKVPTSTPIMIYLE